MSSCTVLTNNTVCGPGFAGAVISNYASFVATVGQIANATTFTDAAHGCLAGSVLNTVVGAMRYQTAWACAVAVMEGCASSNITLTSSNIYANVTLCPVSASLAVSSYSAVYASSTCPATPTAKGLGRIAARNVSLSMIIAQSLSASSTSCLLSVPNENICGFVDKTQGATFCQANPTQLCCVSPSLLQVPVVHGTVVYPISNAASTTAANNTTTVSSGGGMILSNSAMAGLVVAVVAVLVGVLAAVNYFRKKKRANSVRSSKAYTFDRENENQTPTNGQRPSFTTFPRKLSHASDKGSDSRQQKQQTPVPLTSTAYASYNAIVKPASVTRSKQSSNNNNSHLAKQPPTIAILTSPRGREIKRPSPSDNSSSIQNNPSLAFRNQQTATQRSGFSSFSEVTDTNPSTKQITSSIQFNARRASSAGQSYALPINNYNNNQFSSAGNYLPSNDGNNYSLSRVSGKENSNNNAMSAGSNSPSIEFIPIPGFEVRRNSGSGSPSRARSLSVSTPTKTSDLLSSPTSKSPLQNGSSPKTKQPQPPSPVASPTESQKAMYRVVNVVNVFEAGREDELNLTTVGQEVVMFETFSDGWAYGAVGEQKGFFPLIAVQGGAPADAIIVTAGSPAAVNATAAGLTLTSQTNNNLAAAATVSAHDNSQSMIASTRSVSLRDSVSESTVTTANPIMTKRLSSIAALDDINYADDFDDDNEGAVVEEKRVMRVVYAYAATQGDELTLMPGGYVNLLRVFEDGWGLGEIVGTREKGAFPMTCCM
ncbi:hypothetical protein HK100_011992 [Physocladia obscura]|uniref:SH3 domain-containing protein n=1 Tax=Physocladia obscura TaxID=109957 RepID=A0AAD5XHX9_9FUNG|nr:hypothetical protein HK100_011992 [Physocladia obscura]